MDSIMDILPKLFIKENKMLKYWLNRVYALALIISIVFLFGCTTTLEAQWSSPIGYTPYAGFRLYANGANAGADSLNQNLLDADSLLNAHQDTLNTLKAVVYNIIGYDGGIKNGSVSFDDLSTAAKANIVQTTGTQSIAGVKSFTDDMKVENVLPAANVTYNLGSPSLGWYILYADSWVRNSGGHTTTIYASTGSADRTIRFPDASGTVALTSDIIATGYRTLWAGASTSTSGTAPSFMEYTGGSATSITEATTHNIRIPFYKTGDEDSLVCYFDAYYFLDGNTLTLSRVRFYIDGDGTAYDGYRGQTDITTDEMAGFGHYVLRASISDLPVGIYSVAIAISTDLATYTVGTAYTKVGNPIVYIRY